MKLTTLLVICSLSFNGLAIESGSVKPTPRLESAHASERGDYSIEQTVKVSEFAKDAKKTYLKTHLILFASAFFSYIAYSCKTISSYIFMISSAFFITNESALFNNFSKEQDNIKTEFSYNYNFNSNENTRVPRSNYRGKKSKNKGNSSRLTSKKRTEEEKQIDRFIEAQKQTKAAVKVVKRKADYASIFSLGFALASVVAFIEYKTGPDKGACIISKEVTSKSNLLDGRSNIIKKITSIFLGGIIPNINATGKNDVRQDDGLKAGSTILGFSSAYLFFKSSGGIGLKHKMQDMMSSAINRAILFGGFSLVGIAAANDLLDTAKKLKYNSDKYGILAQRIKDGSTNSGFSRELHRQFNANVSKGSLKLSNSDNNANNCVIGGGIKLNLDRDCSCKKTNSCAKAKIPNLSKYDKELNIKGTLASSAKLLGNAINSSYSGDIASASVSASKVGKLSNSLKIIRNKLIEKINTKRKKKNKKPILHFEKKAYASLRKIFNNVEKGINDLPESTRNKILSAFPISKKLEQIKRKASGVKLAVNKPTALKQKSVINNDFSFLLDEDEEVVEIEEKNNTNENVFANKKVPTGSDINSNSNENIFNILTNSYKKIAYPRFFEQE